MNRPWMKISVWISIALMLLIAGCACTEEIDQNSLHRILEYIDQNQPAELELRKLEMKPQDLWTLKENMPNGATLHFTTKWNGITISDTDEELDMTAIRRRPSVDDMEKLIKLLPDLKKVDISGARRMYNEDMICLIEEFPQIEFVWRIELNSRRNLCTTDTAFSTFNSPRYNPIRLTSGHLELLRYAPNLKALDLGHNYITSLSFLRFFPDLELLILADNPIRDIKMIGTLKHLKYLEIFNTPVSDLSPLANCTELLDLNISYCPNVSDLSSLSGLTMLERVWGVRMRGLSTEEKEKFILEHPQTEIKFEAEHATAEGWREHERYTHYVECLKNHQWIPFDQPVEPEN